MTLIAFCLTLLGLLFLEKHKQGTFLFSSGTYTMSFMEISVSTLTVQWSLAESSNSI